MAQFLFAQWDGGGSLPPELTVVRQLVAAGHTVTVLGDPVTEAEVRAAGVIDFRPWIGAPHHTTRRADDDYIRDWELRNPTRVLANLMDTLMVKPAPLFAAETLAAIDDVRPDAIAVSFPLLGALLAAEVRRIPCAALVPNVVCLPADGMPPFGTGFLPPKGRLGRTRDRALNAFVDRLWNKGLPELNRLRATLGLSLLQRLLEQYEQPERVLALTSASFDFPAALPSNVRYVGPQLDDPAWAEPWTPPDNDRPLVLVAMSTTYMNHLDQLQRAVTALGTLPIQGLVTTGPAIDPDQLDVPDGVIVVRSAPHRDVLAHTDVLVTHGGHGTVMKGLVAGVPIVCMPTGRDQPDNAARLAHRGAGLKISKNASPAKIAAAIEHVRNTPSFRTSAGRLGDQLRADADSGAALAELEALASPARTDKQDSV
ncbi:MAG: glycosyltransferase [Ilumatobacteraceae bacterium]